jgi:hypothetical protein
MTTQINRVRLEELFFVFITKSATPQDFKNYYNLIKTNSRNNYLKKIKVFFQNNYKTGFNNYVSSILSEEYDDIIKYFDTLYLPHLLPKELLNYIDEKLLSIPEIQQVNMNEYKYISQEIKSLLITKKNLNSFPMDLIFYFYIIQTLIRKDEVSINIVEFILSEEFKEKYPIIFKRFSTLATYFKNNELMFSDFNNLGQKAQQIEMKDKLRYIYVLKNIKKIYHSIYSEITTPNVNKNEIKAKIIQTYLDYFSELLKKDNCNKTEDILCIFNYIRDLTRDKEYQILPYKWIILQIKNYNILPSIDQTLGKEIFKFLFNLREYETLIDLLFYFVKFEELCNIAYIYVKNLKQQLLDPSINFNDEDIQKFIYVVYYVCLKMKTVRNKKKFSLISKFELNLTDQKVKSYFAIHCIFIYLHSGVRNSSTKQMDNLQTIFQQIQEDQNYKINPIIWVNINENFDSFSKQTTYISKKFFGDETLLFEMDTKEAINQYPNKPQAFVKALQTINVDILMHKYYPYILFCKSPNTNSIIFSNTFISQHLTIPLKKQIHKDNFQYELKGYIIIKYNDEREVILYDKYSLSWYFVVKKEWKKKLDFEPNMKKVLLVYFLRNSKKHIDSYLFNCQPQKHMEGELYESSFIDLFNINPKLIEINYNFFRDAFELNNVDKFLFFYHKLKNSIDLEKSKEGKKFLMFLIKGIDDNYNLKLNQIKNEMFDGNLLYETMSNFVTNLNSNTLLCIIIEDILFDLEFCSKHLSSLINVPDTLILWILLLFLKTKNPKEIENIINYDEFLSLFLEEQTTQKQFQVLSSKVSFDQNIIKNIISYYNNKIVEYKENYRFVNEILLTLLRKNKEKWFLKLFEKLFNQHKYLFNTHTSYINENKYISPGIQLLFRYVKTTSSVPLYTYLIKFIFEYEFDNEKQDGIIDKYVQIMSQTPNENNIIQNLIENDKLLRKCLIKSRPYCQKIETLLFIEYLIDNYKIMKESKKIERIASLINNFSENMDIYLPYLLLYKDFSKKILINNSLTLKNNELLTQDYMNIKRIENESYLQSFLNINNTKPIIFIEISEYKSLEEIINLNISNYHLKGLILTVSDTKILLFRNKYNKYWYSLKVKKWQPNKISEFKKANKKILACYFRTNKEKYQNKLTEIFYKPEKIKKFNYSENILNWYKKYHEHFLNDNKDYFKIIFGKKYK